MSFSDELTKDDLQLPEFEEVTVPTPTSERLTSQHRLDAEHRSLQPNMRWTNTPPVRTNSQKSGAVGTSSVSDSEPESNKLRDAVDVSRRALVGNGWLRATLDGKWMNAIPSWAISTVVHLILFIVLAAISFDPIQGALSDILISAGTDDPPSDALTDFTLASSDPIVGQDANDGYLAPFTGDLNPSNEAAAADASSLDLNGDSVVPIKNLRVGTAIPPIFRGNPIDARSVGFVSSGSSPVDLGAALNSRNSQSKGELLKKYGGTPESERAVTIALKWMAQHQNADGSWTFELKHVCNGLCTHGAERPLHVNRNAATGLALLTFLGAGNTHFEGEYKSVVQNGIRFLLSNLAPMMNDMPMGSWIGNGDNLYGHGIATIAICEAYGMTKDSQLQEPAQRALNFIMFAQHPEFGGWRYQPRLDGDTSVVAWQIMALRSGAVAGLNVNIDTIRKASRFLDSVQTADGYFYGYRTSHDRRSSEILVTTSCALLCRIYMGMQRTDPRLLHAISQFEKHGPDPTNMYYNYYATQVLKQVGGNAWLDWNQKMREYLIRTQVQYGHMTGSWFFDNTTHGNATATGGRLYSTAMAAMTLEVYYRYMPVYSDNPTDDSFKL